MPKPRLYPSTFFDHHRPAISAKSVQGSDTLAYVKGIGWSWMADDSGIYTDPTTYKIVRDQLDNAGHNAIVGNRWKTCIA